MTAAKETLKGFNFDANYKNTTELPEKINFYRQEIEFFFFKYLNGELSLEDLVKVKNNPKRAFELYTNTHQRTKKNRNNFNLTLKGLLSQRIRKKADDPEANLPDKRDKMGKADTYMYDVIDKIRMEPNRHLRKMKARKSVV